MRCLSRPGSRGLSLIELTIGLAVAAVLLLSAAPMFGDLIANSRLREAGNTLHAEALFAQSEAIKRNGPVRLSTDGAKVEVFDRALPDAPVLLRRSMFVDGVSAVAATIDFGSEGRPVPFGASGAVDLSIAGHSCSSNLRCPRLRVEAGGAIRLCGNRLSGCE